MIKNLAQIFFLRRGTLSEGIKIYIVSENKKTFFSGWPWRRNEASVVEKSTTDTSAKQGIPSCPLLAKPEITKDIITKTKNKEDLKKKS